jgi:hypothetical protein
MKEAQVVNPPMTYAPYFGNIPLEALATNTLPFRK